MIGDATRPASAVSLPQLMHALSPGGTAVGAEKEQAQDELREAEPRSAILLRQEHYP